MKMLTPVIFGGEVGTREKVIGNIVAVSDQYVTVRVRRQRFSLPRFQEDQEQC